MKRFLIFACLAVNLYTANAQTQLSETEKLASLCKIWGFLKYYHPEVAQGKFNWDQQLMDRVNQLDTINNKDDLSNFYIRWINDLGEVKKCSKCDRLLKDAFTKNLDLQWVNDSNLFTVKLIQKLNYIKENRNQGTNYYVEKNRFTNLPVFDHENAFNDSIYPSAPMRLLTLSRYWNIINYFYPYKYKTDQKWDSVLTEMIPIFINSDDTIQYQLSILKMTSKLCDTHAGVDNLKYLKKYFGYHMAPFKMQIIETNAIITQIYNDSLAMRNDIQVGDVILNINKENIPQIVSRYSKYFLSSNTASTFRTISNFLFSGNKDSVYVKLNRNGEAIQKYIYMYLPPTVYKNYKIAEDTITKYKILDGQIGYINMGLLKEEDVKVAMKILWDTKAIIFDLRNYPHGTILKLINYLYAEPKKVFTTITPEFSHPGIFKINNPAALGKKNKNTYKGKVIILVNEQTQSHAESTAILLRNVPGSIIMGSQTAGADGQVISFMLPGNIKTWITGEGIIKPDIQRNGVKIDIEIKPTIEGIREHKDDVLDRAIKYVEEGQ